MARRVSWIKAALKQIQRFPKAVQEEVADALVIAAAGETARSAKPLRGLGPGVFEIVLQHRRDAFRIVYAVKIGRDIWVVHAFQKKSKTGIKTPKQEIEIVRERLKRLKEMIQ
jgi:phage-related protein